jgi:hypothetical protein
VLYGILPKHACQPTAFAWRRPSAFRGGPGCICPCSRCSRFQSVSPCRTKSTVVANADIRCSALLARCARNKAHLFSVVSRQEGLLQLGLCHKKLRSRTSRVCCFLLAARSGRMQRPEDAPSIPSPFTFRCWCQNHMTQLSQLRCADSFQIRSEKQQPSAHRHHTLSARRSISCRTAG